MYKLICLSLLALVQGSLGHGSHESTGPAQGETIQEYAQRHVRPYRVKNTVQSNLDGIDVLRTSYVR